MATHIRRAVTAAAFCAAVAAASSGPISSAVAQDRVVDLELVLAVDVSWSMDIDEQRVQRQGYVDAFRHPEVIAAIQRGDWGRIAVTYVEWAGASLQRVVVPWMIVSDASSGEEVAAQLEQTPIGRLRRTSISSALSIAQSLFDENPYEGLRRVVDVSGDGPNNMGIPVTLARDRLLEQGVTVNGLPIMLKQSSAGGYFALDDLDVYYEDCVIGGFGAFVITVSDPSGFSEAIRRKLILEIASAQPRTLRADFMPSRHEPRVDCLVGEKQWQHWRGDRW